MGNCLVLQEKVVRVMKTDGKILEYKHPIKVHQILSEFSHHAIFDKLPLVKHMHPNTDMLQGHLYYLLPLPLVSPKPLKKMKKKKKKKKVRFSDDVLQDGARANGVVRIKLVIELQRMLSEGEVSLGDILHKVKKQESTNKAESCDKDDEMISKGLSPTLECIPEMN